MQYTKLFLALPTPGSVTSHLSNVKKQQQQREFFSFIHKSQAQSPSLGFVEWNVGFFLHFKVHVSRSHVSFMFWFVERVSVLVGRAKINIFRSLSLASLSHDMLATYIYSIFTHVHVHWTCACMRNYRERRREKKKAEKYFFLFVFRRRFSIFKLVVVVCFFFRVHMMMKIFLFLQQRIEEKKLKMRRKNLRVQSIFFLMFLLCSEEMKNNFFLRHWRLTLNLRDFFWEGIFLIYLFFIMNINWKNHLIWRILVKIR